ncbi:MAG: hypothetical protein ABIA75_01480 [Candidatus Neomarinimicrobiota bacterium]
MNTVTPPTNSGLCHKQIILKQLLDERLANAPTIFIDGGEGNRIIRRGGYLAMHHFNHICSARDVRLRELRRDHRVPVSDPHIFEDAFYYDRHGHLVHYRTPHYRIDLTPEQILAYPWEAAWRRPFRWVFDYRLLGGRAGFYRVQITENDRGEMRFA